MKLPPSMRVERDETDVIRISTRRPTVAAMICDCSAPGRSMRNTRGLRGQRHVDHVLHGLRLGGRTPLAKALLQQRLNGGERRVAHDQQQRIVRAHPSLVERLQLGAGQTAHRFRGASTRRRIGVRMTFTVDQLRHDAIDRRRGLRLLLLDGGERRAAQAFELFRGKRGVQQHIGVQLERLGEPVAERIHVQERAIERRTHRQWRAQRLRTIGDFR
jgi:hypothetical protein